MSTAESTPAAPSPKAAVLAEIESLGLEKYRQTLDEQGFVLIPPEIADPNKLAPRMLDRILEVLEERSGIKPDLETGASHAGFKGNLVDPDSDDDSPWGESVRSLIHEGRVFEEALMNPVVLALTTYLCGYSEILSSYSSLVKGPNKSIFQFHSDILLPPPWPDHALVCNATYVLTPFDREHGSTAFLPGSHKFKRGPLGKESDVLANPDAVPIEAEPGSIFVWHGNTWHGAFPRNAPGLRVSTPILFARPWMRTEEDLFDSITPEALERNPARFAHLTHQDIAFGWKSHADYLKRSPKAYGNLEKFATEMGGVPRLNPMAYDDDLIFG
jgi:hypothetical protein